MPGRCLCDWRTSCVHVWRSGHEAVVRVWRWRVRCCPQMRGAAQLLSSCPLCSAAGATRRGCSSSCSAYGASWCTCAGKTTHTDTSPADLRSKSHEPTGRGLEPVFITGTRRGRKKIQRKSVFDGNQSRTRRVLLHVWPGASGAPGHTPSPPESLPSIRGSRPLGGLRAQKSLWAQAPGRLTPPPRRDSTPGLLTPRGLTQRSAGASADPPPGR